MSDSDHKLRVFLCHASQDKPVVRELYQRLVGEGWIDPWLDEEKLLPGQDWDLEIEKAVEASDAVIVCISKQSVTKEGYIQKEIRKVLDIALEKPDETIFIIPLRLDECDLPRRLRTWQFVDYFPVDQQNRAYQRLLQSLHVRFAQLEPSGSKLEESERDTLAVSDQLIEQKKVVQENVVNRADSLSSSIGSRNVDLGGSILLIVFFALAALNGLTSSNDVQESLLGISAILVGIAVLIRKQIPMGIIFKTSLILYLLLHGLGYRLDNLISGTHYIAGAAAAVAGITLALKVRAPQKTVFYSSISFASFLFLVGTYELATNISYNSFTNTVDILILVTSIITSILLWMDL